MGERYQTTDACELALHSCAPLRCEEGGENGGIGNVPTCIRLPVAGYVHVPCSYPEADPEAALMNSAVPPNCQALLRSIGSVHSL